MESFITKQKRNLRKVLLISVFVTVALLGLASLQNAAPAEAAASTNTVYRYYNSSTSDHFYTTSITEGNNAVSTYGYRSEGIAWDRSTAPTIHRLLNPRTGDHFYTANNNEALLAQDYYGYHSEGIGWVEAYPNGPVIHRLLNPRTGDHFYTADNNEALLAQDFYGYRSEGIAWGGEQATQLTISDPTITTTKEYNGNTDASVTVGTLSGVVSGDDVTVSAIASYDTKNVDTDKSITVVYTLGGADAGRYVKPANYVVTTGEITAIQLTITGSEVVTTKTYDGDTDATVSNCGTLAGVIGSEDVDVECAALYDTKNIGTDKSIYLAYALIGDDIGNYLDPVTETLSGRINAKGLTVTGATVTPKVYDGNTDAVIAGATLTGVVTGEEANVVLGDHTAGTFKSKDVADGIDVTTTPMTISGSAIGNYTLTQPILTGVITAKQLTIEAPTVTLTKLWDGNTSVETCTPETLIGVVPDEIVTRTCVATYDNSNVGTSKTINVVYTIGGANMANYLKPVDRSVSNGVINANVVSISAIEGITPPVTGATPVTTITANAQYTGTVSWAPANNPFGSAKTYTAWINITANMGYTLTGVTANFFSVAGATSTSNMANMGVVAATFPATATTIAATAIGGVTPPVTGATPVSTVTAGPGYTGTVTWAPDENPFHPITSYTATITLSATAGYTLTGVGVNQFTIAGSTSDTNAANSGVITAVFSATEAIPLTAIGAITGTTTVGQTLTAGALTPGGATVNYKWQIADAEGGSYSDIGGATSSTYELLPANVGKYLKVVATATGEYSGTQTSAASTVVAPAVINIAAIPGVTQPVTGATPVIVTTETAQYTGTIVWAPADNPFATEKTYTAWITLTPKTGYTLTGVSANFFTVVDAPLTTIVTNAPNSGVVAATFPATFTPGP